MTDGDVLGSLLRSMLGPPEPRQGPPYAHTLSFPQPETDDDGNPAGPCEPPPPAFTVQRGRTRELAPIEPPASFRCRCRLTPEPPADTGNAGCYFPLADPE